MSARTEILRLLLNSADALTQSEIRHGIEDDSITPKAIGVALSAMKTAGTIIVLDPSAYPARYTLPPGTAASHTAAHHPDGETAVDEPAPAPPTSAHALTLPDPIEQADAFRVLADRVYQELKANGVIAIAPGPSQTTVEHLLPAELSETHDTPTQIVAKKLLALAVLCESWPDDDAPPGIDTMLRELADWLP